MPAAPAARSQVGNAAPAGASSAGGSLAGWLASAACRCCSTAARKAVYAPSRRNGPFGERAARAIPLRRPLWSSCKTCRVVALAMQSLPAGLV